MLSAVSSRGAAGGSSAGSASSAAPTLQPKNVVLAYVFNENCLIQGEAARTCAQRILKIRREIKALEEMLQKEREEGQAGRKASSETGSPLKELQEQWRTEKKRLEEINKDLFYSIRADLRAHHEARKKIVGIVIFSSSVRQIYRQDLEESRRNGSGSCFSTLTAITEIINEILETEFLSFGIKARLNKTLPVDIIEDKVDGYHFDLFQQEREKEMSLSALIPHPELEKPCLWDERGIFFPYYFQMHIVASQFPTAERISTVYDDEESRLVFLQKHFEQHQGLIPRGSTLQFLHYTSDPNIFSHCNIGEISIRRERPLDMPTDCLDYYIPEKKTLIRAFKLQRIQGLGSIDENPWHTLKLIFVYLMPILKRAPGVFAVDSSPLFANPSLWKYVQAIMRRRDIGVPPEAESSANTAPAKRRRLEENSSASSTLPPKLQALVSILRARPITNGGLGAAGGSSAGSASSAAPTLQPKNVVLAYVFNENCLIQGETARTCAQQILRIRKAIRVLEAASQKGSSESSERAYQRQVLQEGWALEKRRLEEINRSLFDSIRADLRAHHEARKKVVGIVIFSSSARQIYRQDLEGDWWNGNGSCFSTLTAITEIVNEILKTDFSYLGIKATFNKTLPLDILEDKIDGYHFDLFQKAREEGSNSTALVPQPELEKFCLQDGKKIFFPCYFQMHALALQFPTAERIYTFYEKVEENLVFLQKHFERYKSLIPSGSTLQFLHYTSDPSILSHQKIGEISVVRARPLCMPADRLDYYEEKTKTLIKDFRLPRIEGTGVIDGNPRETVRLIFVYLMPILQTATPTLLAVNTNMLFSSPFLAYVQHIICKRQVFDLRIIERSSHGVGSKRKRTEEAATSRSSAVFASGSLSSSTAAGAGSASSTRVPPQDREAQRAHLLTELNKLVEILRSRPKTNDDFLREEGSPAAPPAASASQAAGPAGSEGRGAAGPPTHTPEPPTGP